MKRYLKNLLAALLDNNPYEAERDDLAEKLTHAIQDVKQLRNMYCEACENWGKSETQVASLQQLVENLRERIKDKDAVIEQYIIEVDTLRGECFPEIRTLVAGNQNADS